MEGARSREAGPVVKLGGYMGSVVMQVDLVVVMIEVVAVSRGATDVGEMPSGLSRRQSRHASPIESSASECVLDPQNSSSLFSKVLFYSWSS